MKKKIIAVFLMLSVMCCTMITALAENVNIEHDDETDCVEISGNAGASMKKKNVKAVITYSETTFNDVLETGNTEDFEYIDECFSDAYGNFKFTWKPTRTGFYNIEILVNGKTFETPEPYWYASRVLYDELMDILKNGTAEEMQAVFENENNILTLQIGKEYYEGITDKSVLGKILYNIRELTGDKENILSHLDTAHLTALFSQGGTDERFDAVVNTLKNRYSIDITVAGTYKNIDSAAVKSQVTEYLKERILGSFENLDTDLKNSIILNGIRFSGNWSMCTAYLDMLEYSAYDKTEDKSEVKQAVAGKEYKTVELLKKAIDTAISAAKSKTAANSPGHSGSGGGGSSPKGSGVSFIPTIEVKNTDTTEESSDEEKLLVFDDVTDKHWACTEINYLKWKGYISGAGANLFYPDKQITRAEMITMLVKAFGIKGNAETEFTDVSEGDWYYPYVSAAYANGIVNGSDGKFNPDFSISREDMAVMIYRVALYQKKEMEICEVGFSDANSVNDYAAEAVGALFKAGIIGGFEDNSFRPRDTATKAQAAKMIYQLVK